MPLVEAHEYATQLEDAIRSELGPGVEVESHIEPQPERLLTGDDAPAKTTKAIITLLTTLAKKQPRLSDLHNIRIRENDQGLFVHYHCRFAPSETVDDVHSVVDQIENGLQGKFPAIRRVIAHAEPIGRAEARRLMRVIRPSEYRVMPWKNGGGVTTEIYASPPSGAFDWRVSIATVNADGPFSAFTGYERHIMTLSGEGMALDIEGRGKFTLEPLQPFSFSGDAKVHGSLLQGAVMDFNLMVRRDFGSGTLRVRDMQSWRQIGVLKRAFSLAYVLQGECEAEGHEFEPN